MDDGRVERPDRGESPAAAADVAGPGSTERGADPGAADAEPGDPPTAEEAATASSQAARSTTRRALKMVVTLRPGDGPTYRAVLALGADGCDPLLRSAEVGDLQAALDEVPGSWPRPRPAGRRSPSTRRRGRPGPLAPLPRSTRCRRHRHPPRP